jgi:lipoyl(octanoyl) transferase
LLFYTLLVEVIVLTIEHWGLVDYRTAWKRQQQIQHEIQQGTRDSVLVLCEHPTVITVGKNGTRDNVLLSDEELRSRQIEIVHINRGGDVTLHNPGQLVGYLLFRLTDFKPDLHWFLREIEQCIIETLQHFELKSERYEGYTGVWIEQARKICAIGINCSRWVTAHGFALNVENNIGEFDYIVPCGITNKAVTSVAEEYNRARLSAASIAILPPHTLLPSHADAPSLNEIATVCAQQFRRHFATSNATKYAA